MRGTIHLVSRRDFIAWRPIVQPVLTRAMQSALGGATKALDVEAFHREAREIFSKRPCTFAELRETLGRRLPKVDERVMGYCIKMQLPLVQTPETGATWAYRAAADFALADAWLGEPLSDVAEPHAMALRYFAAFGPASAKDLQTWSGLRNARSTVDELRPRLLAFRDVDGRELFDVPRAPRPEEDVDVPVRFLPEFDSLLLAHDDRRRIVADRHRPHLSTRNLMIPAAFLVDGFVSGLWRVERKKEEARLVLAPFGALDRRTLEEEGERLLRFVEPDADTYVV